MMTIPSSLQPEVELVNTRTMNGFDETGHLEIRDLDSSCYTNDMTADSVINANGIGNCSPQERLGLCISWCEKLQQSKLFEKDKVPFPSLSLSRPSAKASSRTTIGLVLRGCVISELVPGGPAHCSGELQSGDTICKINGQVVSDQSISSLLIGDDIPDSKLVLSVQGKQDASSDLKDVELTRAPAGVIGDRVRLFELFAAQKERALAEERSRVQCQSLLENLHAGLIEIKRAGDEDRGANETEEGESNDSVEEWKQRTDAAERLQKDQSIRELKRELDQARNVEKELKDALESSQRQRQLLQSSMNDLKASQRHSASGGTSTQDQLTGVGDLFVATKVELDKARGSMKVLERENAQYRSSIQELDEERLSLKDENNALLQELKNLMAREADLKRTLLESAENLEQLQSELECERRRAVEEFRSGLEKDVALAKMKEEIGEARRRLDELQQRIKSPQATSEVYLSELADLSQRCLSLQNDVNSILILFNRLYEAICQASKMKPCGIGIRLRAVSDKLGSSNSSNIIIDDVFEGGPGALSGKIFAGDGLVKIDGCDVHGLDMDDVRRRILGIPGTIVTLHVVRGDPGVLHVVELTRSSGTQEALPNLEEQTADACALATALYVSLDHAKYLLAEAESEKELMRNSILKRENDIMKTVFKWAETVRGQQVEQAFQSWAHIVLRGVQRRQKASILLKHISFNLVRAVFYELHMPVWKGHLFRKIERLIERKECAFAWKRFFVWRDFCALQQRNYSKGLARCKFRQTMSTITVFQKLSIHVNNQKELLVPCSVKKLWSLKSRADLISKHVLKDVLFQWSSSTLKQGTVRLLALKAQKKWFQSNATAIMYAWRELFVHFRQIRYRAGRLLSNSLRRSCHEYLLAWEAFIHLKRYLHRLASRQAERLHSHVYLQTFIGLHECVVRRKRHKFAFAKLFSAYHQQAKANTFSLWNESTVTLRQARHIVDRYMVKPPKDCLAAIFENWLQMARMTGIEASYAKLQAQGQVYCETENNLVKQVTQTSERAFLLQSELASESKKLANEMKKNSEFEAALANARDEIAAYSQQVEYLRKQVREAWASSDAARADLAAAIKSSDQMRNALFGRHETDASSKPASPDAALFPTNLHTSGIAVSSPSPLKRLDASTC